MHTNNQSEKGQAIVFLVVGLVVFLGFVALALDGGMALADRRHSQNSADAAALAGAGAAALNLEDYYLACYEDWTCLDAHVSQAEAEAVKAAHARGLTNGFDLDNDLDGHLGVVTDCKVDNYPGYSNKFIEVTVEISATTQSNFAQILFPEALHNEVDAIARVHPRQPIGYGNAIIALNPADCSGQSNGLLVHGNGSTIVSGGGMLSNGCIRGDGTPSVEAIGKGVYGKYFDPNADWSDWNPAPVNSGVQVPPSNYDIQEPNCSATGAQWVSSLDKLPTHLSGLYCITGDLKINASDQISGTDVTIYVPYGKVTINGTPLIQLSASENPDAYPQIPGVLLYLPPTNSNPVTLNGTADSFFRGLVLAPKSSITLTGTNGNSYEGQVIGWNVEVGGTNDTVVEWDGCKGYTRPSSVELSK